MPFQLYYAPDSFTRFTEFGMGFHIVSNYPQPGRLQEIYILYNQEFMLPIDEIDLVDTALISLAPADIEPAIRSMAASYTADLQPCDPATFSSHPLLQRLTAGATGRPTSPSSGAGTPTPTPPPYGHLPFHRQTLSDSERFVRYTIFRNDRRVTPTGEVVADTFAAPASEERVIHNGFAAVGRFALPSLLPAVWRRDIIPPAGTPFVCGAVVPMFGQAGGGAEAKFIAILPAGSAHLRVASVPEI
jgi:hypothetical protein